MRKINKIIIHCSATPEGKDYSVDTIRDWHVNGNGWSDIGYHFVVYRNGQIHAGRPIERSGAHTRGQNSNSIGIVYIGGMTSDMKKAKDTRTEEQKIALFRLVATLKAHYGPGITVHGHNEFASKACPSFDVRAEEEYHL